MGVNMLPWQGAAADDHAKRNFDEREREWALEGFPDSKALLFVEAPDSAAVDAIGKALVDHVPGLRRLRRQSIDPDTKKVLTTFYMDNRKDTTESRPDEWSEAVQSSRLRTDC